MGKTEEKFWEDMDKIGFNKDIISFSESDEMDKLMEEYRNHLIQTLAGIPEKENAWMHKEIKIGRKISRAEAIEIATQIMVRAEKAREDAYEEEAKHLE